MYNTRVASRLNSRIKFSRNFMYNFQTKVIHDIQSDQLRAVIGDPVGGQFGIMQVSRDVLLSSINQVASPIEPQAQYFVDNNIVSIRNAVAALSDSITELSRIRFIVIKVGLRQNNNNYNVGDIYIPTIMNESYVIHGLANELIQEVEMKGELISEDSCRELMDRIYNKLLKVYNGELGDGRDMQRIFTTTFYNG